MSNSTAYKLMNDDEVAIFASRIHDADEEVVFANGCFDLLHLGHLRLLHRAKECGDYLIVAVNSDMSVKRLKGEFRPYISGPERCVMLAELGCVDAVISFNEDTPLELIKQLKPNVLVRGNDAPIDHIVGAREVQSWGGRVERVPLAEGLSTTAIARQIWEQEQKRLEQEKGHG
jgi:D-beta-D-heptose 7-phosphate kinase/D-beta-D-heptose 1-phosphate adenosyltransferase